MGTIWTPGGEHPVGDRPRSTPPPSAPPPPPPRPHGEEGEEGEEVSEEELRARMEELRDQLAATPAEVVVANHCYGLFELAALHLSLEPPQLPQAQLAIDALAAVVEGLAGRLGEPEAQLREALSQLRLAFVQIRSSGEGSEGSE